MKKHLERQSGVQNVEVSLIDGKVKITPKEDARIEPGGLLKAVYDSGVSVAEMDCIVRGKVVKESSGDLALQVEPNQSFTIAPNEFSKELESANTQMVTVRGQLYKKVGKKKADISAPLKLIILEIQRKE